MISAAAARRGRVPPTEERLFRASNRAPDGLELPAWLVMQSGSLASVLVVSAATRVLGGRHRAAIALSAGSAVWAGVKAVKPLAHRGRPADLLDGVVVRGQPQVGLGYPSGHAAVSTTLALTAMPPGRGRRVALAIAGFTGLSRMYVGAHLPLDVVGGLAIGTLVGTVVGSR
ncbi:MAG: phosphatase PAP2 family protein [Ilumatobacter sp.]|uniref:phosphatase PAP2 family protein n=1 Tax=Ilumatobacter sp. TaxID=1967498 RepID=UPI00263691FB|nr:phosphatase PAP2 family protein [Ilumatobacter sp.]MDJ0768231.1 phosphatase PAP2 family protein [Ilumatobacter sp.]